MNIKEIKKLIKETIIQTVPAVMASRQGTKTMNYYKMTESRLYAYPILKHNVEVVYPADIADLKKEKTAGHSTSIVLFSPGGGGEKLSPAEAQERRIMLVEIKMQKDKEELHNLDQALEYLQREGYCGIIRDYYILGKSLETIAEDKDLTIIEAGKIKSRLVKQLAIRLYGALALEV